MLLTDLSLSWSRSLAIQSLSLLRTGRLSLSLRTHLKEWQLRLPFKELVHVESLQALRVSNGRHHSLSLHRGAGAAVRPAL